MQRSHPKPQRSGTTFRRLFHTWTPKLVLLPTLLTSAVFVYFFIFYNGRVSISNWSGYSQDMEVPDPWYSVYVSMLGEERFQAALRNMIVFTVFFLIIAVFLGLVLALMVREVAVASGFFRNLFLFPYALSFIVTGVIWRWLFNPESGVNLLLKGAGLDRALEAVGIDEFEPGWLTDPKVVGAVNNVLSDEYGWAEKIQVELGIPMALIPIIIAASWQFMGFSMAFFLAALGGVPTETIEAARLDGASWWQIQRRITLPLIRPAVFGVTVILLFSSLKIFDLIVAMSGTGPGFSTDIPALYVYDQMFSAVNYNKAAAAATAMLILVAIFAVPYLRSGIRKSEVTR